MFSSVHFNGIAMMSSDQIEPERDLHTRQEHVRDAIYGRAWVKLDFEFWRRCTVDDDAGGHVAVSLDNMDEWTVAPDCVRALELEPHDLVFVQHWEGNISGYPAFVVAVN